jgi:hypothetical protein
MRMVDMAKASRQFIDLLLPHLGMARLESEQFRAGPVEHVGVGPAMVVPGCCCGTALGGRVFGATQRISLTGYLAVMRMSVMCPAFGWV